MEEDPIAMTALSILYAIGLIAAFWLACRNGKIIRNSKIREEDGTLRSPTKEEVNAIAHHLAHDKGKHFWHLIIAGIILVGLTCLALKYFLFPQLDL